MGGGAAAEAPAEGGEVPAEGGENGEAPPEQGGFMGGIMGKANALKAKAAETAAAAGAGNLQGMTESMAGGVMGQVSGLIPGMKKEEEVPDPAAPAEGEYAEYTEEQQYAEQGYEQGYAEEQYAQWEVSRGEWRRRRRSRSSGRRGGRVTKIAFQTHELEEAHRATFAGYWPALLPDNSPLCHAAPLVWPVTQDLLSRSCFMSHLFCDIVAFAL